MAANYPSLTASERHRIAEISYYTANNEKLHLSEQIYQERTKFYNTNIGTISGV